ncbi:hypothetical protein pb186bvf_006187 [Paramecium bursaria]
MSVPPIDKIEFIRQKYGKLTRVNQKGFISTTVGKSSDFQSINSQEDDEKTLLKSIQRDVKSTIERYQEKIQTANMMKLQRESSRAPSTININDLSQVNSTITSPIVSPKEKPKGNRKNFKIVNKENSKKVRNTRKTQYNSVPTGAKTTRNTSTTRNNSIIKEIDLSNRRYLQNKKK